MAYTKAQKKATIKYMKNAYDCIEIKVPKGRKEVISNYAESKGESTNAFIIRLINQEMGLDAEP